MGKIFRFLLIPSAIAALLCLATPTIAQLILFFIFGCCAGLLSYLSFPFSLITGNCHTRVFTLCSTSIFTLFTCSSLARLFYTAWFPSSSLSGILSRFFPSAHTGLIAISGTIAVLSIPFIFFLSYQAIFKFILWIRLINFKKGWMMLTRKISVSAFFSVSLKILLNLILAVALGTCALYIVYKLPIDSIKENVRISARLMKEEGNYPSLSSWSTSQLDNWTDSIMLLEAADDTQASTLDRAMSIYRGNVDGYDAAGALIAHYVHDNPFTGSGEYTRYWHGYHIYLKPMLAFMNYGSIRQLNGIVQLLCVSIVCLLLLRRGLKNYIIPFILAYLMLMPAAIAKSLQYSSCFYIILFGMFVLLRRRQTNSPCFIFLNIGILTAYFDFLTYPMATFGVPAALYIMLRSSDEMEQKLLDLIKNGIFWCIGWGGMWFLKWYIAHLTIGYDFIHDAFNQVAYRISGNAETVLTSLIDVELANYKLFIATPITLPALGFAIYLIISTPKVLKLPRSIIGRVSLPYTIVGLTPVVWYAFVRNHSAIHSPFTNKACVVTFLSLLFALVELKQTSNMPHQKQSS